MAQQAAQEQAMVNEAVGIFDDASAMQDAITDLESSGFARHQISVLGSEFAVKKAFGSSHIPTGRLEDNPRSPRAPNVTPEELRLGQGVLISGGILTGVVGALLLTGGILVPGVVVATVAVGGAGGAVGAVLAKLLGDKYAEFFQNQMEEGGMLLWVNTPTPEMEAKAQEILRRHGGRHVHVHRLPASIE